MGRRIPITLWLGIAIIVFCEALLFADVSLSHRGAVETEAEVTAILRDRPTTLFAKTARYVAINMTAFVWIGYLLLLEGTLTAQMGRSPVRSRKHHFWLLCLASVFIWCVFDAINFRRGMRAWEYIGIPARFEDRLLGYLFAFAAIVPSMLMSGQVLMNWRWFDRLRSRPWTLSENGLRVVILVGAAMCLWPLLDARPITNLTLWTSLVFFLDPINMKLNRPSLLRDWQNGWYGRTAALFAGGLVCGLLWEFWNYWALAKWVYHLEFLGPLEHVRYFQMPVIGLLGFLPFGAECWVMWQTIRIALDGLAEQLPDDRCLL
jgi:hypothetical protein